MLSSLLVATLARTEAPTRAERVLALLSEVSRARSWYHADTIFESVPPPLGNGPVLVPRVALVMCGDRNHYALDDERARQLGRELFAIYGLAPQADRREAEGVRAVVLDGLDPVAGVGESHGAPLFLPSSVELTEPFELELELSPGRYSFGRIHLGTAARE